MKTWLKNPLSILAENAGGGILLEGTCIIELVPAGKEPSSEYDSVFDASRHVIIPGLINLHHHFYQTLTRVYPQALNKELFPWLKTLYPIWAGLTPEALRISTRLALAELLLSGCTTASDQHYVFTEGLEDAIDLQVEESKNLGIRVVLCRGSMDRSQKDGGLPPDSVVQTCDQILADCERLIQKYHNPTEGAMNQIVLAPCSPFSVSEEVMRESSCLAEKHNVLLHTHLAETEDENSFCLEKFGCRPLDDSGLVHKQEILQKALDLHAEIVEPKEVLATFGGFEITMMAGAMLESAVLGRTLLIDGFIAGSAFLAASRIVPEIMQYAVFTHQSDELGHGAMLKFLKAEPLLSLGMRLGEGTGAAIAYPLLQSAVSFLNEMASFESAGVSERSDGE